MIEKLFSQGDDTTALVSDDYDDVVSHVKAMERLRKEAKRKADYIKSLYMKANKNSLSAHVKKAHRSMFGLDDQSDRIDRSGLIVTEKILILLRSDIKEEKLIDCIKSRPAVKDWAPVAFKEWSLSTWQAEGPGKWWPYPILYDFIQVPDSTVRIVISALICMGVVETRNIEYRPNPKSRAKALRLTKAGEELLEVIMMPMAKEA